MATLLAEWGFLDNLDDTSGNARHGAAVGFTPAYTVGPQVGTRALILDDPAARVEYGRTGLEPADADGGIVSMAWVKLNASHTDYTEIIAKLQGFDSTRHAIKIYNNTAWFMARWKDRIAFNSYGDLSDNNWHHLCCVDADDRFEFYIDGVSVASGGAASGGLTAWQDFPWGTGDNDDATGMATSVDMLVSQIRVFSGTMTTTEVNTWKSTPIGTGEFGTPEIISTTPELEQITIAWGEVSEAAGYRLFVDGVEDPVGLIASTSYLVTGLTQGQVYEFTVLAEKADTTQSAQSTPVSERASMIVSSTQLLNTSTDDPNAGSVNELALGYLPDGTPGLPYLGWRWNDRSEGNDFWWWERESVPRTPVYPYLGPWTHGMTIQKESGDTVRVIEWNRGADIWRETDLVADGEQVTIDHNDLTMNAGGGPIGAAVLNCTLIEHSPTATDAWTIRLWDYYPVPLTVDSLVVDDSVPGELTATWTSDWNDFQVRIDSGSWINKGALTSHTFTEVSTDSHTVEARLTTPIGEGPATAVVTEGETGMDDTKFGSGDVLGYQVGDTPVQAMYVGDTLVYDAP